MGRFYTGDIKGKFWFGVQSSDDASYFGGEGRRRRNSMEHRYDIEHLPNVRAGIVKCMKQLGQALPKLDDFFSKHEVYNEQDIEMETGIKKEDIRKLLTWYARLELGMKIVKRLRIKGQCKFKAEL